MMKLISDEQLEAVEICLVRNIPFALFSHPGEKTCRFMAAPPDNDGGSHAFIEDDVTCTIDRSDSMDTFYISTFCADEPYTPGVRAVWKESNIVALAAHGELPEYSRSDVLPSLISTRRGSYDKAIGMMTARVRKLGGKVVLSRMESVFSPRKVIEVAEDYFNSNPQTFRYLCQTPETGLWLGATPELLLRGDTTSGRVSTMALAGTRSNDDAGEWDDKNIAEHEVVADYIVSVLEERGVEVERHTRRELVFGPVKHLCTPITGNGCQDIPDLIAHLNTTPAVLGVPPAMALAEIDVCETHRRRCYSGAVGTREDDRYISYVNLRCAFAAPARLSGCDGYVYNLYAGGGIMPDSEADSEWAEADAKMSALRSMIARGLSAESVIINPRGAQFYPNVSQNHTL